MDKTILYHLRHLAIDNAKIEWRSSDWSEQPGEYLDELERYICELFSVEWSEEIRNRALEPYYWNHADIRYVYDKMAKIKAEQRLEKGRK